MCRSRFNHLRWIFLEWLKTGLWRNRPDEESEQTGSFITNIILSSLYSIQLDLHLHLQHAVSSEPCPPSPSTSQSWTVWAEKGCFCLVRLTPERRMIQTLRKYSRLSPLLSLAYCDRIRRSFRSSWASPLEQRRDTSVCLPRRRVGAKRDSSSSRKVNCGDSPIAWRGRALTSTSAWAFLSPSVAMAMGFHINARWHSLCVLVDTSMKICPGSFYALVFWECDWSELLCFCHGGPDHSCVAWISLLFYFMFFTVSLSELERLLWMALTIVLAVPAALPLRLDTSR